MVELAPNSKTGLNLNSAFLLGSGAVGWGDAWPPTVAPEWFGAFVTPPLTLQARRGTTGPRLAEIPGGFILNTGDHNPGLRSTLRADVARCDALPLPVIDALSQSEPDDWLRLGERLAEIGSAGLEAHLPAGISPREAGTWIANLKRGQELPVLVKVRATQAGALAEACAAAGADALVVATPPIGAAAVDGQVVEGSIAGPVAFPFTLRALRGVAALNLGVPLIASGGIMRPEDVRLCRSLGAAAVQLRSLMWTSPASVREVLDSEDDPDGEGDRV